MFKKENKIKASIDFLEDDYELLKNYKNRMHASSMSEVISYLIRVFLSLDADIKLDLAKKCDEMLRSVDELNGTDYLSVAKKQKHMQYSNLYDFFTNGKTIIEKKDIPMKRIEMRNGYVIVPDEWIELPSISAEEVDYVGVVEVRNGEKYGTNHYLFFWDKPINQLNDPETRSIFSLCEEIDPNFRNMRKFEIELAYDKEKKPLNGKEWLAAPLPGIFPITEYGNILGYGSSYPFGAVHFKTK